MMRRDVVEGDRMVLDVLYQACGFTKIRKGCIGQIQYVDNQCVSPYERACDYLCKKGILTKKNDRIYKVKT